MDEPQAGDMAKLQAAMIEPQTTYDTGHTREQELAQLRAELQTALQDKADVEVERAVTVDLLRKARESRRRLVCLLNAVDEELPPMTRWYSNLKDRAELANAQRDYALLEVSMRAE